MSKVVGASITNKSFIEEKIMKTCYKCKAEQEDNQFSVVKRNKDGLGSYCRACESKRRLEYYTKKEQGDKQYREERTTYNRERLRGSEEARAKNSAAGCKWAKENPGKHNAKRAKRRAAKVQAIPLWFDKEETELIYRAARAKSARLGEPYEVDHIVPIQGDNVCGLHWSGNLQIISMTDNRSKGFAHAN